VTSDKAETSAEPSTKLIEAFAGNLDSRGANIFTKGTNMSKGRLIREFFHATSGFKRSALEIQKGLEREFLPVNKGALVFTGTTDKGLGTGVFRWRKGVYLSNDWTYLSLSPKKGKGTIEREHHWAGGFTANHVPPKKKRRPGFHGSARHNWGKPASTGRRLSSRFGAAYPSRRAAE